MKEEFKTKSTKSIFHGKRECPCCKGLMSKDKGGEKVNLCLNCWRFNLKLRREFKQKLADFENELKEEIAKHKVVAEGDFEMIFDKAKLKHFGGDLV